jgi:hypothetical protein
VRRCGTDMPRRQADHEDDDGRAHDAVARLHERDQ